MLGIDTLLELSPLAGASWVDDDGDVVLPVLLDVECPFEGEVVLVVVVDELGDGVVVATGDHA